MITKQDIENQRELIQNDLTCVLDGIDDDILTNACQVVVDRMNILISKLEEKDEILCDECGGPMVINQDGTTNHLIPNSEGIDSIDHAMDENHIAIHKE